MARLAIFAAVLWTAVCCFAVPASYEAFHTHLCDPTRMIYKERTDQTEARARFKGAAAIWCQAIFFDMAVNAVRRARETQAPAEEQARLLARMRALFGGEKKHYVDFDFDNPSEDNGWFVYDDIMWWVAALARAAEVDAAPDAPPYLALAERAFHRVWYGSPRVGDTGSYADPAKGLGGGMFWEWQPIQKARPNKAGDFRSACITFPTVISCCLLHDRVPADRTEGDAARPTRAFYKAKAVELYAWGRQTLVPDGARVADGIHKAGPEFHDHLYNQATFIGAACLLHRLTGEARYLDDACRAADYVRERMCRPSAEGVRLLPVERGPEQGVYAAIFAQYMDLLVHDRGQTHYLPWLAANLAAGLRNRDARGLQDARLGRPLRPGAVVQSYDASALPALELLFGAVAAAGKKPRKPGRLVVGIADMCPTNGDVTVGHPYVAALAKAGHAALVIPETNGDAAVADLLGMCDLLLLCGGADIAPDRYGEAPSPQLGSVNARRDAFECRVLAEAVKQRKPVFGICRGCQLLNVFFGGSLVQDIPSEVSTTLAHRHPEKGQLAVHAVKPVAGTRLAAVLGEADFQAVTSHHQCVERLAPGLRVAALAPDGVVEAIEATDYPAAGVQFHPEKPHPDATHATMDRIFQHLATLVGIE